jgi:chromosome segregation ATPase
MQEMYPEDEKFHQLDVKVSLLARDVQQTDKLCERLSESIEKLYEVNASLTKMITLHEQRHEQHEKVEKELKDDIKDLHSRITTVTRELHDKIDEVEKSIGEKIDDLRREIIRHEQRDRAKLPDILREIDKYKWMILGGAIAAGWIIGHVNLEFLGKLLK